MRIYIRESLKDEINEHEIFHKSRSYIDWYCEMLGVKMPFSKLDHIFIPELPVEVSEHPGGLTYNDKFVQKNWNPLEFDHFNMLMSQGM